MSRNDLEAVDMLKESTSPDRSAAREDKSREPRTNGKAPATGNESDGDDTEDEEEDEMAGIFVETWREARKAKAKDKRVVSHTYEPSVEFKRFRLA